MHENQFSYRLSAYQKSNIAQNLIDVFEKGNGIEEPTARFIGNWILTGPNEKRKVFYDVWDIVLKNFMPITRPILFRSCSRRSDDRIASFTGRIECARRFSGEKGLLLICDTAETLKYEQQFYKRGEYRHTFYPLSELLKKDDASEKHVFSEGLRHKYAGEDEYIMRIDIGRMNTLKWYREKV